MGHKKKVLGRFERHIASDLKNSTAVQYASSVEKFLIWLEDQGYADLTGAPRNAVTVYCESIIKEGYTPLTVRTQITAINRFVEWCRAEKIPLPILDPAKLPENTPGAKDVLSHELLGRYLRLADDLDEPARTAVKLLPYTGFTGREMVSLPLRCLKRIPLHFKDGTVLNPVTITVEDKGIKKRFAPLLGKGHDVVIEFLEDWRRTHPDNDWFFPGRNGYLSERTFRAATKRIRESLQMRLTTHTMRRTYLMSLHQRGVDPETLAKIAGYRDVKTLMKKNLYLRPSSI